MDADALSRLELQLRTPDGHWDEVTAFTERIINKNFQAIFDQNESMKDILFEDPEGATVDATILAPRIIIPGSDDMTLQNVVYFLIRFVRGTITTATRAVFQDVSKWELAIPMNLVTMQPDSETIIVDGKPRRKCSVNGRIYNYPGDYTVERLFAQFTTARWNDPNAKHTRVWESQENKYYSLEEWKKKDKNVKAWSVLRGALINWGDQEEAAGRSTLNVSFKLPPEKLEKAKPLYVPTFLHQQTYPYKSHAKGVDNPITSADGNGFNALLWCEMIDDHVPPETKVLPWTGNFAVPAAPDKGEDPVDGTFVLSYTHFLERHILPRLQRFNQACEVTGLKTRFWEPIGLYRFNWAYSLGNFNNSSLDPYFQFLRQEPQSGDPNSCASYVFDKSQTGTPKEYTYTDESKAKVKHESRTKVTVSWSLGGNSFDVRGHTEYAFDAQRYDTKDVIKSQLTYKYYFDWEISLRMSKIEDGIIKIDVVTPGAGGEPGNLRVRQDPKTELKIEVPPEQDAKIQKFVTENIQKCITILAVDLEAELRTTASFIYPGAGKIDFANPVINRWGNVLAEIKHKKMETSGDFITVHPPLKIPAPKAPDYPLKKTPGEPLPVLEWSVTPGITPAFQKKVRFVIKATNNRIPAEPVGFSYVMATFSSASVGPNMFRNNKVNDAVNDFYKPAQSETEAEVAAVASVVASSADIRIASQARVLKGLNTESGGNYWHLSAKPQTNAPGFIIPPGESITFTIEADTGEAGPYNVMLSESWRSAKDLTKRWGERPAPSDDKVAVVVLKPS